MRKSHNIDGGFLVWEYLALAMKGRGQGTTFKLVPLEIFY